MKKLFLWIFIAIGLPFSLKADIVYPARLELVETAPGIFEVRFTLPVVQGKVLKAQPLLPEICNNLSEPEVSGNATSMLMTWQIGCEAEQLLGKTISISGIRGSQVDILLSIKMLNGRTFSSSLSPVRPYYEIPEAPSMVGMIVSVLPRGMRYLLTQYEWFCF